MKTRQLSLPLIPHSSFESILNEYSYHTDLSVKVSSRLKKGWYLKINRHSGNLILVIPSYLCDAPDSIKQALIEWAVIAGSRNKSQTKRRTLELRIREYIGSLNISLKPVSRIDPHALEQKTKGFRFDLREVFDQINKSCFNNSIESMVRWGSPTSTTSYQTTVMLTDHTKKNLITIAGVYNHKDVPRFALEAVMFHEMLHIFVPPYKKNGRNVIHGPEFKKVESRFIHYEKWHLWEQIHLRDILKKKKRQLRRSKKAGAQKLI